ncbi:MAG: AAA family ATPase [Bacteroidetes bacterium]|nr:AAA family ATPase [Bacteroidota bacterium]
MMDAEKKATSKRLEAKEWVEGDPDAARYMLGLREDTPDEIVVMVAEEEAAAFSLEQEIVFAHERVQFHRDRWNDPEKAPAQVGGGASAPNHRILIAKPFNEWLEGAATRPRARRVFGDCFFEGEFCIFFGETNTGKTICAVQIAQAVASGRDALSGFATEVGPMKVLYYDFELSDRQSYGRYSDDSGHLFSFHRNFIRAEVSRDFEFEGEWADALSEDIEALIVEHKPGAVFIDNLTAIRDDTEKSRGALPLMRRLNTLKRRYDLSMMGLAHTPKRDASRPLSRNDLAGSRNILNLCDSCFAIGESHRDPGTRYLKQIKVRETDFSLDTENVAFLSLDKQGSFLGFNLIGYGSELEHLRARSSAETSELDADILALRESEPNLSNREMGRQLNTNHVKVGRVLKRAAERAEDEAREGGTSGTELVQSGTGSTGVPVFHPSIYSGNGTLRESGTVEQVFQGVPPSENGVVTENNFPWTEKHGGLV